MLILILTVYSKGILLSLFNPFHKNRAIISCILLLFFLSTTTFVRPSQASGHDPEIEYKWIEYLFKQGETVETINEGLRFIYFNPTHKFSDNVRMFIGRSYLKDNKFDKAMKTFRDLSEGASSKEIREESNLWLCNSLLKQGNYPAARQISDDFLNRYPHSLLKDRAQYQKALSFLKEWKWEDAEEAFREIDPNSRLFSASQEIIKETQDLSRQSVKSPVTAGILSIILPGSGYMYAGKWQTGIAALIVNGAFAGASIEAFDNDLPILGSIIGLLEIGWYSGTIYGSIQSVKNRNYRLREEKLRSIDQRFTMPLLDIRF